MSILLSCAYLVFNTMPNTYKNLNKFWWNLIILNFFLGNVKFNTALWELKLRGRKRGNKTQKNTVSVYKVEFKKIRRLSIIEIIYWVPTINHAYFLSKYLCKTGAQRRYGSQVTWLLNRSRIKTHTCFPLKLVVFLNSHDSLC